MWRARSVECVTVPPAVAQDTVAPVSATVVKTADHDDIGQDDTIAAHTNHAADHLTGDTRENTRHLDNRQHNLTLVSRVQTTALLIVTLDDCDNRGWVTIRVIVPIPFRTFN